MATDKRARKRDARAARDEALRQRRNRRLIAVGVVIAVVIGMAFFASTRDKSKDGAKKSLDPAAADATPAEPEGETACGAEAPETPEPNQYDAPPKMVLEEGVDYSAVIHTSCGDITLDLLEDEAPITVNNFVFLARDGFYTGLTWHRIVSNFVIQGGDPEGTGQGGPGYTLEDELPKKANDYVYGAVAMANSGRPDTNGSQFFIVVHEPIGKPAGLQALYSLFGKADEASFETLGEIARQETLGGNDPAIADMPVTPVYIDSIEIVEN